MNNINVTIEKLLLKNNLGTLIETPIRINGGLSHKMYKAITDNGIYAVKELNSGVMKRPEAYSNFMFSEKVTEIAIKNGINAIGAIKINNEYIKKIDNKYFMIFNWVDGQVLNAEEITEKHSETIGKILAEIHNIDFSKIDDNNRKRIDFKKIEWNSFVPIAEKQKRKYVEDLKRNIEFLYEVSKKANEGLKYATNNLVISHTDLDRKNVMWNENKPIIIDWEASGYINPTIELLQVAWYWSGGDIGNIDYTKYKRVIDAYKKIAKKNIDKNIEKLIYADIYGGLNWLEYNLKRSLNIESIYEQDEIELAENEVIGSLKEIKYNINQISNILNVINNN